MALDSSDDVNGFSQLISISKAIKLLDSMGYSHKLAPANAAKVDAFRNIAKKMYPEAANPIDNAITLFSNTNVANLIININNTTLGGLEDFLTLIESPTVLQEIKQIVQPLTKIDEIKENFNEVLAFTTLTTSKLNNVLSLLSSGNYTELLRMGNFMKYLDDLSLVTADGIDKMIAAIPSAEIDKLIADIPILSMVMPNFASYTASLNGPYLVSLLTPENTFCSPCLVQFFGASGLKSDIMSWLNSNITNANSFLNAQLDGLTSSLPQLKLMLGNFNLKLGSLNSLTAGLDGIIDSLLSGITTFLAQDCSPLGFLLGMLKSLKMLIMSMLVFPLEAQINGLKLQIDGIITMISLLDGLKDLIPKIDC